MAALETVDTPAANYYQAFLRNRWKMPCREKYVQACIAGQFSGDRAALTVFDAKRVETLIRLDKTDHIDETVLQKWWEREVMQAGKSRRCESIAVLSSQPSGRKWLLSRIQTRADKANTGVEKLATGILRQQVVAAQRLQRWDYRTSDECTNTIEVLETAGI